MQPNILSHYEVLEKLGEGGMGVVYKARDTRLNRYVALKFLPPSFDSPESIARFQAEANVISALNHPNISTIYDIDQSDGKHFLVLEYLPGGTLGEVIRRQVSSGRELSLKEITGYGTQIAEGLAHAHRHGIIHRDVKSDNVMLTADGKIKITDFGLAKLRGSVKLTRSGAAVGTPASMSPEQTRGEEADHRSDIFSLGICLYELATGRSPFRGEHEAALTYAIVNEDPIPLKSLRPSIPPGFEKIVRRCLEKDRELRYQNAEEIVRDLQSVQSVPVVGTPPGKRRLKSSWVVAGIAAILAILAFILFRPGPSQPAELKSIAVLPFKNMSEDRENEYFSDGVTEDIITQLSKIGDLKVISRTSVMRFKETSKSLGQIAQELGVTTILEGSVRRADNKVRVVAQLIDARNDHHLWAETYDRELTQIFAIQSDVAHRIADALQARLSPSEQKRFGMDGTLNLASYNAFLKAQYHWIKLTKEDVSEAIDDYHVAIASDSLYARAYAGLSIAYSLSGFFGFDFISRDEAVAQARAAAQKSLALNPDLAEAHTALGYLLRTFDWDFPAAEAEFQKAIALNPNYSIVRDFYSLLLAGLGRFDEAIVQSNRAGELDPLSIEVLNSHARVYYYAGRYDEAIALAKREFEVEPESRPAHGLLGAIYEMKGMKKEALAEILQSRSISGTDYEGYSRSSEVRPSADWDSYWNREYAIAEASSREARLPHIVLAIVALRAGKKEQAIQGLIKSFQKREGSLVYLNVDPLFAPVREDSRVSAVLREMKLR